MSLSMDYITSELIAAKAALAKRDITIAELTAKIADLTSARPIPIADFLALPKYADFVKGAKIKKCDIGPEWQEGITVYNRFFPFSASARVYVETKEKGKYIELVLDHAKKTYSHSGIVTCAPSPLLKELYDLHFISHATVTTAWQNMLISIDGGNTYLVAKDLQDHHITRCGKERKKVNKFIAPRV